MSWAIAADASAAHLDRLQRVFAEYPTLESARFVCWPNGTFHMTGMECDDLRWPDRDDLVRAIAGTCKDLSPSGIELAWATVTDDDLGHLTIRREDLVGWSPQPEITWASSELPALDVIFQGSAPPQPVSRPFTVVQAAYACRAMEHLNTVRVRRSVHVQLSPDGVLLRP